MMKKKPSTHVQKKQNPQTPRQEAPLTARELPDSKQMDLLFASTWAPYAYMPYGAWMMY